MRKRPSAATVIAMVALFVSLAGTAVASIIISNNSQVAPHVIGGANAPSGDHKNLIPSSVGSSDLHPGAVTGTKLAVASVSPSKLNLPKIDFSTGDTDPNASAPHHTVLSLDGLTLGIACFNDAGEVEEFVYASTSASDATLRGMTFLDNGSPPQPQSATLSTAPTGFGWETGSGPLVLTGILTYRDPTRVITLTLDGVVNHTTNQCSLDGTAIPAPN